MLFRICVFTFSLLILMNMNKNVDATTLPYPWGPNYKLDDRQNMLLSEFRRDPINFWMDETIVPLSLREPYNSYPSLGKITINNDAGEPVEILVVTEEEIERKKAENRQKTASKKSSTDYIDQMDFCFIFQQPNEYWAIEWCHRSTIQQFHLTPNPKDPHRFIRDPDWSLGSFIGSDVLRYGGDHSNHSAPVRKVIDRYQGGQHCDETQRGRETQVHIQCCRKSEQDEKGRKTNVNRPRTRKSSNRSLPKFLDDIEDADPDELRHKEIETLSEATRAALLRDNIAQAGKQQPDRSEGKYHGSWAKFEGHRIEVKSIKEYSTCKYQIKVCADYMCVPDEELDIYRTVVRSSRKSSESTQTSNDESAIGKLSPPDHDPGVGLKETLELSTFMEYINATCLFRQEEWWTYELCFSKGIRQYHSHVIAMQQADGKIIQTSEVHTEFSLGHPPLHLYDNTTALIELTGFRSIDKNSMKQSNPPHFSLGMPPPNLFRRGKGDANVLKLEFIDGTPCDLRHINRSTTVEVSCGAKEVLKDIKEDSTCHYVVFVESPTICKVPSFEPTRNKYLKMLVRVRDDAPDNTPMSRINYGHDRGRPNEPVHEEVGREPSSDVSGIDTETVPETHRAQHDRESIDMHNQQYEMDSAYERGDVSEASTREAQGGWHDTEEDADQAVDEVMFTESQTEPEHRNMDEDPTTEEVTVNVPIQQTDHRDSDSEEAVPPMEEWPLEGADSSDDDHRLIEGESESSSSRPTDNNDEL